MTEYIKVNFVDVKKQFETSFLAGLVRAISGNSASVSTATGSVINVKNASPNSLAQLLYNNGKGNSLFFKVNDLYEFSVYAAPSGNATHVLLGVSHHFILGKKHGKKIAKDFVTRSKAAYDYLHPEYALGEWEEQVMASGVSYRSRIFWLNFYGPRLVRQIGTDVLNSTPYGSIDNLADGGVLLIRGSNPSENSEYSETIRNHLFGK